MVTVVWIKSPESSCTKGLVTRLWYWWKLRESLVSGVCWDKVNKSEEKCNSQVPLIIIINSGPFNCDPMPEKTSKMKGH